ncbi:GNAT family N-acetyltransferase [Pseudonocardia sp.]|uniref:GNAT family N-acetyltransferase n=1 Tax=Pseudonocardia sp. TaxID=60912 RepID=UPI003D0F5AB5
MATAAVRPATPADVDDIVRLQAGTWQLAYAGLLPEAALEHVSGPAAREAWTAAVAAGGRSRVLVATEGRFTVGFCAAAASDEAPEWAEIAALVVEARWGRRGHGGRLLAAAAAHLSGLGARFGMAWVAEVDEVTRRFYASAGWGPDGQVRVLDTGEGELRELRITGSLDLELVGKID